MSKCSIISSAIVPKEVIQSVKDSHKDVFVVGLSAQQQKEVMTFMSNKVYVEASNRGEYSTDELIDYTTGMIKDKIFRVENQLAKQLEDPSEENSDLITTLTESLELLNTTLDNIKVLASRAIQELKLRNDTFIENLTEKEANDLIKSTESSSEVERERTTYGDNFSLQIDGKKNAPGKLKEFLSNVVRKRFTPTGKIADEKTFFNTEAYFEYGNIYDELHRLLEGVYPSKQAIFERLQMVAGTAIKEKNSRLAWLPSFIETLQQENNKDESELMNLFVRDMSRHYVKMEYVHAVNTYSEEWGHTVKLTVTDVNKTTAYKRLFDTWKEAFLYSPMISPNSGKYRKEIRDRVIEALEDAKRDGSVAGAMRLYFKALGFDVSDDFINAMATNQLTIYAGKSAFWNSNRIIDKMRDSMNKPLPTKEADLYNDFPINFFEGLAKAAIGFSDTPYSNAIRVGDKLIHSYTANHNLSSRTRDLKAKGMEELKEVEYSRGSVYGRLLDSDKDFADEFDVTYISLYPLTQRKDRGDLGVTELSELDREVLHIGYALHGEAFSKNNNPVKDKTFQLTDGSNVTLKVQPGSYVLPTMSDKSRGFTLKGFTFKAYKHKPATETSPESHVYQASALNLYYDSIVKGEIDRILLSKDSDYVDGLNMKTYGGGIFYNTPYLNEVYVDSTTGKKSLPGGPNAIPLTTAIQAGLMEGKTEISTALKNTILFAIRNDLVTKAGNRRNKWIELGLVDDNGRLTKYPKYPSAQTNNEGQFTGEYADVMEIAYDIVFSEEIANATFFQLFEGDPAQYYKEGVAEDPENRESVIAANVAATYSVITKRLAAAIAPGDDGDISEADSQYYQVFLRDIYTQSKNFNDLVEILDGKEARKKLEEYQELSDTEEGMEALNLYIKDNLVAAPYANITSTDAQEYITWQTQLKEMRRYGELSEEEYQLAHKELSKVNGSLNGDILKKVTGPRKPVHSSTVVQPVNGTSRKVFRKTYIKTSTIVLLPQIIKNTKLDALRKSMEALEESSGKSVRATYGTGVKVGAPSKSINLVDPSTGEYHKEINITEGVDALLLHTEGLRIQQSLPFSTEKSNIPIASQPKKLLFTNLLNEVFNYKGEDIKGSELKEIYDSYLIALSEAGLEELMEMVTTPSKIPGESAKVDYKRVSKMLKKELKALGVDTKPALDGLAVNKDGTGFKYPLWRSKYADKYMALFNSLVENRVLKKKTNGVSSVLVSEAGFSYWENLPENYIEKNGFVFTDSFDKQKGLQGMRLGPKGEILPAQVILPFKFRDTEGNLLDIKSFIDPETNLLDISKLPKDVLMSTSFRIPTQLQQSMSMVEVVGFMPYSLGDSVIATQDFVVQMGSDFDVDKLYSYLFNTEYVGGKISKLKSISLKDRNTQLEGVREEIAKIKLGDGLTAENITPREMKDLVEAAVDSHLKSADIGNMTPKEVGTLKATIKKSIFEEGFQKVKGDVAKLANVDKLIDLSMKVKAIKSQYIKGLQNELLTISNVVLSTKAAQTRIIRPLGTLTYKEQSDKIAAWASRGKSSKSIISREYNDERMVVGNAGQTGISIFSAQSVLQANLEGKPVIVGERVETGEFTKEGVPIVVVAPVSIVFGNKYQTSNGELGKQKTLKLDQSAGVTISELISALQNISVDNANLGYMHNINLNSTTANVYALMNLLGYEEDLVTVFMSQPILVEYVKELANLNSLHAHREADAKNKRIKKLADKYDDKFNLEEDGDLADFKGKDAVEVLENMLKQGPEHDNFNKIQVAILHKFMRLNEHALSLNKAAKYMNLDSKGLPSNFYATQRMVDAANSFPSSNTIGLQTLLGQYVKLKGGGWAFTNATTLPGYDLKMGAVPLLNLFGNEFLETNRRYAFDEVISYISTMMDREFISDEDTRAIREQYTSYLNSNTVNDNKALRKELFFNLGDNSLYKRLIELRKTPYGKANKFISNLSVVQNSEGMAIINFTKVSGDDYNDSAIYEDFISMLVNGDLVESGASTINVSEIAQQLAHYGVLKGGPASRSFMEYIPVSVIDSIIEKAPASGTIDLFEFTKQYAQNNPDRVPKRTTEEIVEEKEGVLRLVDKLDVPPIVIKYGVKLFALQTPSSTKYVEIPSLYNESVHTYSVASRKSVIEEPVASPTSSVPTESIHGKTLSDIYSMYSEATLNTNREALRQDLSGLNTEVTVELSDSLDKSTQAQYVKKDGVAVIYVDREFALSSTDDALMEVIMHEHLHALSTKYLMDVARTGVASEAVVRIQKNIKTLIDNLLEYDSSTGKYNEEKRKNFVTSMYNDFGHYAEQKNILPILIKLTTHPVANQVYLDMQAGISLEGQIAKGLAAPVVDMTLFDNDVRLLYAVGSIFEYVAVVPSSDQTFQDKIGMNYPKFMNNILRFMKEMLYSMGIRSSASHQALADIYEITGLAQEESIKIYEVVVQRGGDIYKLVGDEFLTTDYKTLPGGANSTAKSVLINEAILSAESMIGAGQTSGVSLDRAVSIIEDTKASLYSKVLAMASLPVEVRSKYNSIFGIAPPPGLSTSTTITPPKAAFTKAVAVSKFMDKFKSQEDNIELKMIGLKEEGKDLRDKCKSSVKKWGAVQGTTNLKAAKGMYIPNERAVGTDTWEILTTLDGPSHAKGGISLNIVDGKVNYSHSKNPDFKAEDGVFISADSFPTKVETETSEGIVPDTKAIEVANMTGSTLDIPVESTPTKVKYTKRKVVNPGIPIKDTEE